MRILLPILILLISLSALSNEAPVPAIYNNAINLKVYYNFKEEIPQHEAKLAHIKEVRRKTNEQFWIRDQEKILVQLDAQIKNLSNIIASKWKVLQDIEKTMIVKIWQMRAGVLELNETSLGSANSIHSCPTLKDGMYQYFENEEAFEKWNARDGGIDKKIDYYAHKDKYIANCIEKTKENKSKKINKMYKSICRKKTKTQDELYYGTEKKYQVKKVNGQIVIDTTIAFSYKGDSKRKKESFKIVNDTIPCIKDFFARHGLKLELTIKEDNGKTKVHSCDHKINLHNEFKRNNTANWSTHKDQGSDLGEARRCSMYIHELAHNLGLRDMYADPDCPDRESVGEEDDVMRSAPRDSSTLKFYPYAIKKILGPLCGK